MSAAARSFLARPEPESAPAPALTGLTALRAQVAGVVTATRPAGPPWGTGVASLDAALGGGIPRGRITEVVGAMGAGRATLLRETVSRVLVAGGWVAWIDARRTAAAQSWAGLGNRLVMIRPRDARRGAWCADQLLRSGVFALVVLDGAPALSRVQGVRLAGIARERDAGFVVIGDGTVTSRINGSLRLRVARDVRRDAGQYDSGQQDDREQDGREQDDSAQHDSAQHDSAQHDSAQHDSAQRDITRDAAQHATEHATQHAVHRDTRGFLVIVEKGGNHRTVEVNSAVIVARRMSAHSEIPDRRGVARGSRRPWAPSGGHTSDEPRSVTWGGLGASVGDVHGRDAGNAINAGDTRERREHGRTITAHVIGGHGVADTGISAGAATGPALPGTNSAEHAEHAGRADHAASTERARHSARDDERRMREWAEYRGRRRAAESRYSRPSRRESRREQQYEREREREWKRERRAPALAPALGRVATGIG